MTSAIAVDELVALLAGRGETVAFAESLTGGLLTATLVEIPGSSAVVRGGVVAYATDLKALLLDVPDDLLAQRGAVDPQVAEAMARGVAARLQATYGVACTGVAGPAPQDGHEPGTVHVAVVGPAGASVRSLTLRGDRTQVRSGTVVAALDLLAEAVRAAA